MCKHVLLVLMLLFFFFLLLLLDARSAYTLCTLSRSRHVEFDRMRYSLFVNTSYSSHMFHTRTYEELTRLAETRLAKTDI